jgi:3-deoxy-D-manno-octulosonic-acid transferase
LAFVGGSLVPIGGHDPAEPAALGKPVIFGPHMENAGMAAELLLKSGGAEVVRDADAIIKALEIGLKDRALLVDKGRRCRDAILSVAGVSRKMARILVEDQ